LTVQNAKTTKGEKLGILTGILYLAPAQRIGRDEHLHFFDAGMPSGVPLLLQAVAVSTPCVMAASARPFGLLVTAQALLRS